MCVFGGGGGPPLEVVDLAEGVAQAEEALEAGRLVLRKPLQLLFSTLGLVLRKPLQRNHVS